MGYWNNLKIGMAGARKENIRQHFEVKATKKITAKHVKGLNYLKEEGKIKNYYLVSQDPIALKQEDIYLLPWDIFVKKLWAGEIV